MRSFVTSLLLGFMELCFAHTCLFHGWLGMAAELTGFADREFYQVLYVV